MISVISPPYDDSIFKEKMASLVVDPGFLHAVNYTMPKEDVPRAAR